MERHACLRECAYYRFLFWNDMAEPPPKPLRSSHTLFSAAVRSGRSVDLRTRPYDDMQDALRSPVSYTVTQTLGTLLREVETEVLLFASARGPGTNVALYRPHAFAHHAPRHQSPWLSEVDGERATFSGEGAALSYGVDEFCGEEGTLLRVA